MTVGLSHPEASKATQRGMAQVTSQTQHAPTGQVAHIITNLYNLLGQLESTVSDSKMLSYQYDDAGRRTRITWPDGYYAGYDYDVMGRMTTVKENGAATLATYHYDTAGRRDSLTLGNIRRACQRPINRCDLALCGPREC
jgi:YD repeat-containing protein